MTTTTLYLIRHGETDDNRNGLLAGRTDSPLNEHGRAQARRLGERFAEERPQVDHIVVSPLQRTMETARLVFGDSAVFSLDPDLREMDFGIWENLHYADIARRYPELWQTWAQDWAHTPIPEAETFGAFIRRVTEAVERLVADRPGEKIALVTHGGCVRVILAQYLCGSADDHYWRFRADNATLTALDWTRGGAVLTRFNHR
ncbi:MAG: histidine phosphatase family protein [Desulfobulbus sp.]